MSFKIFPNCINQLLRSVIFRQKKSPIGERLIVPGFLSDAIKRVVLRN